MKDEWFDAGDGCKVRGEIQKGIYTVEYDPTYKTLDEAKSWLEGAIAHYERCEEENQKK